MSEPHGPDSLLTPQELADLCRVPLVTVYKWNVTGTGPSEIKVGRHVRYSRGEVDRWLNTRTAQATS